MKLFIVFLIPLVSLTSEFLLVYHGIQGWGWFLFVAFMLSGADVIKKYIGNENTN